MALTLGVALPKLYAQSDSTLKPLKQTSLVVLGYIQDGGMPQAGCSKPCCKDLWCAPAKRQLTISLGLVDQSANKTWMFDASPDFGLQSKMLSDYVGNVQIKMPDGIFLTHGHIGHYAGLMLLGREAAGAKKVPVYAMPRMKGFFGK